ncbi:uncharacterized protein LOC130665678 [Microplitis mediator]|uniref:uncharacterized protein LOC130665678 n=1 Tax=Microplitis mediator TaxID=375433 RepID=UPI002554476B|nr:uncharacterized protein LOC130665678 [Microplitis mediator]
MNNLINKLIISLVIFSSILFVDSHSIDKRSLSTKGVIIGPDTPVYYLEYPHDKYLRVIRDVNKFEASPSYNYYRNPENEFNNTFFPKVLIVLEWYDGNSTREQDILNEVLTEWNKVDTYFEQLDYPKIKLAIAGVVIPTRSDFWDTTIFNQQMIYPYKPKFRSTMHQYCYRIPNYPTFMAEFFRNNTDQFESFDYDFFILMTHRKLDTLWTFDNFHYTYITHVMFDCDTKNGNSYRLSGKFVKKDEHFSYVAANTVAAIIGDYENGDKNCGETRITDWEWYRKNVTLIECSKSIFRPMVNNARYTCLDQIPYGRYEDDYS